MALTAGTARPLHLCFHSICTGTGIRACARARDTGGCTGMATAPPHTGHACGCGSCTPTCAVQFAPPRYACLPALFSLCVLTDAFLSFLEPLARFCTMGSLHMRQPAGGSTLMLQKWGPHTQVGGYALRICHEAGRDTQLERQSAD